MKKEYKKQKSRTFTFCFFAYPLMNQFLKVASNSKSLPVEEKPLFMKHLGYGCSKLKSEFKILTLIDT